MFVNNGGIYEAIRARRENLGNVVMVNENLADAQKRRTEYVRDIERALDNFPIIYSAMLKSIIREPIRRTKIYYRGTSSEEMESLAEGDVISKILSTSEDYSDIVLGFARENKRPASVRIEVGADSGIPILDVEEILGKDHATSTEREVLIAPFVKVKKVTKGNRTIGRDSASDNYTLILENAELQELSPEEIKKLRERIISQAPEMSNIITAIIGREGLTYEVRENIELLRTKKANIVKELKEMNDEIQSLNNEKYKTEGRKNIRDLITIWCAAQEVRSTGEENPVPSFILEELEKYQISASEWDSYVEFEVLQKINYFCMSDDKMLSDFVERINMMGAGNVQEITRLMKEMLKQFENPEFEAQVSNLDYINAKLARLQEEAVDPWYKEERRRLDESIAREEQRLNDADKYISEGRTRLKEWKSDIARLGMAECREKEISLAKSIEVTEAEIVGSRSVNKTNVVSDKEQTKGEQVIGKQSHHAQDKKVRSQNNEPKAQGEEKRGQQPIVQSDIKAKEEEKARISRFKSAVSTTQRTLHLNSPENLIISDIRNRGEMLANEIRSLGIPYYTHTSEYINVLARTRNVIGRATYIVDRSGCTPYVANAMEQAAMSTFEDVQQGLFSREMKGVVAVEENLLKKVVFERFCDIAVSSEIDSFKREADVIRAKAQKKGLARLLGGPSKREEKELSDIDHYISSVNHHNNNEFVGKKYSAHDIIAEMELYRDSHINDDAYASSVEEVEDLLSVMNRQFGTNRNKIERLKQQKAQRDSNNDPRAARVNYLLSAQEKRGIVHRGIRTTVLNRFNSCSKNLENVVQEMAIDAQRQKMSKKHHNTDEVSQ